MNASAASSIFAKSYPQPEDRPPKIFTRVEELRAFLLSRKIPLHVWGQGQNRPIEHLWKSLGEEQVHVVDQGEKHAPVVVVNASIAYVQHYRSSDGELVELYEKSQTFPNGTTITRDYRGIAETRKKGEQPIQGAYRLLAEELGQTEPKFRKFANLKHCPCETLRNPSEKYFGLSAVYRRSIFRCEIDSSYYHKEYVEVDPENGIITCFEWRPQKPLISAARR